MKRTESIALLLTAAAVVMAAAPASAIESRIKDLARIAGLEPVELIGYGMVIGLNGTGDKDLKVTKQTMANLLENFKMSVPSKDIKSKNVAVVMVTATLPAFHSEGDRVDVHVSSIGDASSLQGGQLLMTPLHDAQGEVYALAQGSITVGGFQAGAGGLGGEIVVKNTPTSGTIARGATLRYGTRGRFHENGMITLVLNHPDFTTAERVASVINTTLNGIALAKDAGTVLVEVPPEAIETDQVAAFVSKLEALTVKPDAVAKVIVNERTGTIVMGNEVRIAPAVVAHGNLIVSVKSTMRISQPEAPFTPGAVTAIEENTTARADEDKARVVAIQDTTTVQELASMLQSMGATTSDLISILEALSRAGALQMEIVTM